jgi:hypothetical protein
MFLTSVRLQMRVAAYLAHGGVGVATRQNDSQALHDSHFDVPVALALTDRGGRGEGSR